ncbi:MAG TPA: M20/M25/M40 family metallo-hydrolase, partial [Polyangia bacterium]
AVAGVLAAELARAGWSPLLADGSLCQPFTSGAINDQNVVARLPAPAGARGPAIILGAHYDALGLRGGRLHPGADDNASGVAALLEVARLLPRRAARPPGDVILVFFGAEEVRARGSRHFVAHPPVPLERVALMVNLDQVGRPLLDGHPLRRLLGSPRDAFGYTVSMLGRAAAEARMRHASNATRTPVIGIPEGLLPLAGFYTDSLSFAGRVPALMLSTSIHADYHRPSDTADRIDLGQVERAVRLMLAIAGEPHRRFIIISRLYMRFALAGMAGAGDAGAKL